MILSEIGFLESPTTGKSLGECFLLFRSAQAAEKAGKVLSTLYEVEYSLIESNPYLNKSATESRKRTQSHDREESKGSRPVSPVRSRRLESRSPPRKRNYDDDRRTRDTRDRYRYEERRRYDKNRDYRSERERYDDRRRYPSKYESRDRAEERINKSSTEYSSSKKGSKGSKVNSANYSSDDSTDLISPDWRGNL